MNLIPSTNQGSRLIKEIVKPTELLQTLLATPCDEKTELPQALLPARPERSSIHRGDFFQPTMAIDCLNQTAQVLFRAMIDEGFYDEIIDFDPARDLNPQSLAELLNIMSDDGNIISCFAPTLLNRTIFHLTTQGERIFLHITLARPPVLQADQVWNETIQKFLCLTKSEWDFPGGVVTAVCNKYSLKRSSETTWAGSLKEFAKQIELDFPERLSVELREPKEGEYIDWHTLTCDPGDETDFQANSDSIKRVSWAFCESGDYAFEMANGISPQFETYQTLGLIFNFSYATFNENEEAILSFLSSVVATQGIIPITQESAVSILKNMFVPVHMRQSIASASGPSQYE
jgi:hypothetical protein